MRAPPRSRGPSTPATKGCRSRQFSGAFWANSDRKAPEILASLVSWRESSVTIRTRSATRRGLRLRFGCMSADNPPTASTRSGPVAWRADPLERRMVDRIAAQLRRDEQRPRTARRSGATRRHATTRRDAATLAAPPPQAIAAPSAPPPADPIGALLRRARRQTGMDVAMLGRIDEGHEIIHALAGDAASFGMAVGQCVPLESTYCHLLLQGRIGNVVSDATSHELLRDLLVTRAASVGAYIGVPLDESGGHAVRPLLSGARAPAGAGRAPRRHAARTRPERRPEAQRVLRRTGERRSVSRPRRPVRVLR